MQKTIHSKENSILVSWLKAERQAQGLSMRELAERLEVSHSFVQKTESSERRVDVVEFVAICKALDIKPEDGLKLIEGL